MSSEQPGSCSHPVDGDPLAGEVFEVFARRKPEDPLHHIGYVTAPDSELAGVYARSIYDEWNWIEMVVVPRAAITTVMEQ